MKTNIIILSLCLVSFTIELSGQFVKDLLVLEYTNNAGENGKSTFIYNGRETPYKTIWELRDGSRWSVNYNTFDSNGNMVSKYREFSDSLRTEQFFTYNSDGRLVYETFSRSDGRKGEVNYIYEDDRLVRADCKGLNGWFFGEITYNYQGLQPISADLTKDAKAIGKIEYTYDQKGRLWIETWVFDQGFTQTFTYIYRDKDCIYYRPSNAFLDPGCSYLIKREEYDFCGKTSGPSYYEYDANNRLVEKIYIRKDGLKTVTTYEYLENGLLSASHRVYNSTKKADFSYKYNEHNQLILRSSKLPDGNISEEKFTYDENGQMIRARYTNMDGWLTGELTFVHDRYDRIIEGYYAGIDDLEASITFNYSPEGLLEDIDWQFSNGYTQSYEFTYERINTGE